MNVSPLPVVSVELHKQRQPYKSEVFNSLWCVGGEGFTYSALLSLKRAPGRTATLLKTLTRNN